jgi:hypothetical protein
MKWDPRWSLYLSIIGSGLYLGKSELTHAYKDYDIDYEAKFTVLFHAIIIMYLWLGTLFYERADIILHLLFTALVILMWVFNSNCILSTLLMNKAEYKEDDFERLFMRNPNRIRAVFRYLILVLGIDCLKLLTIKR